MALLKKHIVVLPSWFSRHDSEGIFIREHARMLAGLGHEVACIFVDRSAPAKGRHFRWWTEDGVQYGICTAWFPPKLPLLSLRWKSLYRAVLTEYISRYGRPDLLHAHGYVAGIAAWHLSRHLAIPYVLTEHNTSIPLSTVPWYHAAPLQRTYRDAGALIAVSNFLRNAMQNHVKRLGIRVIYNPVDCIKFHLDGNPENPYSRIICIGSLEPRKNMSAVLRMLNVLRHERDVRLTIIGSGSQEKMLRTQAHELEISDLILWVGEVGQDVVAKHLAQSDLLVSASRTETFGMVIAEALASGIPVVATDSGAPREYLSEALGVLVPQEDDQALLQAVRNVLTNRARYAPTLIRDFAREHFDFPVIGRQVDQVYDSVLKPISQ